ncbi:MAG TPA: putative sulfate exporter family transporter [Chitinophagaceae bacterium]|nr:putative sulfate exporter family transporter [Chitinophagaceae bacterium]
MQKISAYFLQHPQQQKALFITVALLCVTPFISAPIALVLGFLMIQFVGNPYEETTKKLIHKLLQISVVGLGFGMNVNSALKAGKEGFIFTLVSIISVLVIGFLLTKILKIEKITGYLISAGTAICGGSAIAAIAPIVKAKPNQISVALAVIFTLNSIALLLFPLIGNMLHLSQHDFGLWSAIAIHDTSSVVGAASKYGTEALEVATTVKLARALWIIPLSLLSVTLFKNKESKIKIPWFIGFFILAMIVNTYVSFVQPIGPFIVSISKAGLTLTLFLIGAGLSLNVIKNVGTKPLLLAVLLWLFISIASLLIIVN